MASVAGLRETRSFATAGAKQTRKRYYYEGDIIGFGGDDEPIMENVKLITAIDYKSKMADVENKKAALEIIRDKLETAKTLADRGYQGYKEEVIERQKIFDKLQKQIQHLQDKTTLPKDIFQIDMGATDEELDQYNWVWINMNDDRVCPDCIDLAKLQPAPFTEWINDRTEPGRGDTICNDHCRCLLAPSDLIQSFPDMRAGEPIVIADSGKLVIDLDTPYELFAELDGWILQYKHATDFAKLTSEYYDVGSTQGRIDWLKQFLGGR